MLKFFCFVDIDFVFELIMLFFYEIFFWSILFGVNFNFKLCCIKGNINFVIFVNDF